MRGVLVIVIKQATAAAAVIWNWKKIFRAQLARQEGSLFWPEGKEKWLFYNLTLELMSTFGSNNSFPSLILWGFPSPPPPKKIRGVLNSPSAEFEILKMIVKMYIKFLYCYFTFQIVIISHVCKCWLFPIESSWNMRWSKLLLWKYRETDNPLCNPMLSYVFRLKALIMTARHRT